MAEQATGIPITLELRPGTLTALGPLAMKSPEVLERLAGYMDAAGWPEGLSAKLAITGAHLYATDAAGNMLLQQPPVAPDEPPADMPAEIPAEAASEPAAGATEPPATMPPPLRVVPQRKPPAKGTRRR